MSLEIPIIHNFDKLNYFISQVYFELKFKDPYLNNYESDIMTVPHLHKLIDQEKGSCGKILRQSQCEESEGNKSQHEIVAELSQTDDVENSSQTDDIGYSSSQEKMVEDKGNNSHDEDNKGFSADVDGTLEDITCHDTLEGQDNFRDESRSTLEKCGLLMEYSGQEPCQHSPWVGELR